LALQLINWSIRWGSELGMHSEIESMQPGIWILFVTCAVAGVDGLLFGYDTGTTT
jgi:hypothetical protein